MVYLNNDNSVQDVYIPRNDGQGSYVSPCDKCYQEGYNDGCEECGNVNLEDKSVVVTAATQTVLPSSGYDGMTSVDVDATEWGQSKYDEGYDEGYGNGEDDQKARLSSATFVENGEYTLENGWSAVTVQTTCPPCPPCPEPSLENKTVELESGTTLPATITPSSGYDGFGEVTIEDNGYGDKKYDDGFSDGQDDIRNNMSSTAFTQNGSFSNSSGWSAVTVNVPTSGGSNLQNKSVVLTAGTQTVLPDAGYDGMSEVDIDATDLLNDEHTNAFSDGYSQGVDDVRSQFTSTAVTQNGTYQMTEEFNAFSSFTVNVPCTDCTLQTKNDTMTASTQTFTADNLVRPTAPSGETVYGGSIELLEDLIDQYGQIRIKAWDNAQHSDSTLVGYFQYDNGEYMWYFFQGDIPYPFSSLTSSFANVGGVWGSHIYMENDGRNIFFYDDFTNGIFLDGGLTLNDLILPVDGYDGLSAVTVSASALCQDYYTSGYTDGLNDCPSCNTVSDFKTIVTGTDETVCVGFSRPSAPSGETVYGGSYERLKWFMDNYGDITIFSFDDQAHSDDTEQGYFQNYNGTYRYYNHQGDIAFPLDEIGPSWTNTGNNDKFFLWNDGMNIFFYTRYEYGWETNYVILPPESLILELADGDAAECIHIDSSEVRQAGYDEGYADGQADCPLPNLENKTLYLNSGDTSPWTVVPSSGYDGMSEVTVRDNGYGQKKYDDGYADGYNDAIAKAEQPIGLKLDGNSWFDTGIYPDADTKIELFFVPTDYISDGSPLYYAGADNGNGDNSAFYISQEPYPSSGWTNVMSVKFGSCTNNIEIHDTWNNIEHTTKLDSGTAVTVLNYNEDSEVHAYEYNGYIMQQQSGDLRYNQTTNQINFSGMDTCNYTIFIGANNNPSLSSATPSYRPAKCIILCARIYDNGTLVGEFIPRLNNGIPCLYDSVSQTYKNNLGTGTVTPIFGNISLNPRYI